MSIKNLVVCNSCGKDAPLLDKLQRIGQLPTGWLAISRGEAMWSWHACSWDCLRSLGDQHDRDEKADNAKVNEPLKNLITPKETI